jgi:hypothetical protein
MDREKRNLFDFVAQGDDFTLQRLLIEGKEERNIATLAVSATSEGRNERSFLIFRFCSTATRFFTRQLGTGSASA